MPLILERKEPLTSRLSNARNSGIPRPSKQLVLKNGVCHASKPSVDTIPMTPSKQGGLTNTNVHHPRAPLNSLQSGMDPTIPVLELIPFGRQPSVDFGRVIVNEAQVRYVSIRNITDSMQQLFVKTFPKDDKGFNIEATEFLLAPRSEIFVAIQWCPLKVGSARETITLQDANKLPKRIILFGTAVSAKPPPALGRLGASTKPTPRLQPPPPRVISRLTTSAAQRSQRKPGKYTTSPNKSTKPLMRLKLESRTRRQSAQVVAKLLSKHDNMMAIKVQSYWRMILARREANQRRKRVEATLTIQKYCRRWLVARRMRKLKEATLALQKNWRMHRDLNRYKEIKRATILIQSCARGMIVRRDLKERRESRAAAALKIQTYWRMILAKREAAKRLKAVTTLQSYWRMLLVKREAASRRKATLTIQSYWRMILVQREASCRLKAALIIQTHCRRWLEMRRLKRLREATLALQKNWRMLRELNRYKKIKLATILIQSHARGLIARRVFREYCESRSRAALCIQTHWRMWRERSRLRKLKLVSLALQSRARGLLYRRRLRHSIEALLSIQSKHVQVVV